MHQKNYTEMATSNKYVSFAPYFNIKLYYQLPVLVANLIILG